jgi:hypothetical protein
VQPRLDGSERDALFRGELLEGDAVDVVLYHDVPLVRRQSRERLLEARAVADVLDHDVGRCEPRSRLRGACDLVAHDLPPVLVHEVPPGDGRNERAQRRGTFGSNEGSARRTFSQISW